MITGFNTDIEFNGKVYHVQTEDRGMANPIVESLVYHGGEIVASRKSPYADLVASNSFCDESLTRRMEAQHKELIREIQSGKFGTEERRPFGHGIVTNRSLDDVALTFLNETIGIEQIELRLGERSVVEPGRRNIELTVFERNTERPVCGATVVVSCVMPNGQTLELYVAATDEQGRVVAPVDIPATDSSGGRLAIVCLAEAGGKTARLEHAVAKKKRRAGVPVEPT